MIYIVLFIYIDCKHSCVLCTTLSVCRFTSKQASGITTMICLENISVFILNLCKFFRSFLCMLQQYTPVENAVKGRVGRKVKSVSWVWPSFELHMGSHPVFCCDNLKFMHLSVQRSLESLVYLPLQSFSASVSGFHRYICVQVQGLHGMEDLWYHFLLRPHKESKCRRLRTE